jgi:hypothetical protein
VWRVGAVIVSNLCLIRVKASYVIRQLFPIPNSVWSGAAEMFSQERSKKLLEQVLSHPCASCFAFRRLVALVHVVKDIFKEEIISKAAASMVPQRIPHSCTSSLPPLNFETFAIYVLVSFEV